MTNGERGYVLFHSRREPGPPPAGALVQPLLEWRAWLYRVGLIGVYPDGIGFGNLSFRVPGTNHFVISGTGTGAFHTLTAEQLTLVTSYDFEGNSLTCRGPVDASSESLSHAAVYAADPEAGAVVHVHHAGLWSSLLDRAPTTERSSLAGTPEMARAVESLVASGGTGLIVMGGHPEGLIAYGRDVQEAGQRILGAMHLEPR